MFFMCVCGLEIVFFALETYFVWLRTPWDMSKKGFFSDFQNFDFCDNGGHFSFFSLYKVIKICLSIYVCMFAFQPYKHSSESYEILTPYTYKL